MKKRAISLMLFVAMLFSVTGAALAAETDINPAASQYLDGYYVVLAADGGGKMLVGVSVNGVGVQDKIGVARIDIEEKANGVWSYYDTLDAAEHPEFYTYDERSYVGSIPFYGTAGNSYRVTVMVYAKKGNGSDTGYITSYTTVCK